MPLDRYREIVPNWPEFLETLGSPEPVSLRIRQGLTACGYVIPKLESQGFRLTAVESVPAFYRVDSGPGSVAQTPEHWLGLFHIQQSVMGLPSLALAPRPGDRVLDLCAAPGGKTAHLAELMEDEGPLVAVDPKEKRLRGLLANIYRLGHPNVLVIAADGRSLPLTARFDRVLVDAPCSAEGTLRRQGGRLPERSGGFVSYVTTLQEALLRRAVQLVRPGGEILYSTCTFAPEENEAVVDRVVRSSPLRIEPIALEAPHAPGLLSWNGEDFHPDLIHAWRVYPHHLNSGGLFMARLRRLPPEDGLRGGSSSPESPYGEGWGTVPAAFPGQEAASAGLRIEMARHELEYRFGLSAALLDQLGWMVRADNIWAHTARLWPVSGWQSAAESSRWRVVSLGLRASRRNFEGKETPSNHFLSRWGRHLGPDRQVELDREQLLTLLAGRPLPMPHLPAGPIALFWEGTVLGRGMVGHRGLVSEIPRAPAERLQAVLRTEE